MTRRDWLRRLGPAAAAVDHLLLGAPDLDEGVGWLEKRTGVKAAMGGAHPGVGTRNALAALGGRQYLEIIAPDPAQTTFGFQIDLRTLTEPRLVTWAAASEDVDAVAADARAAGLAVLGPRDGSRKRPDGSMLRWRTVGIAAGLASATVDPMPFFIQWGADATHPASDSPAGLRLAGFEFGHPDPSRLQNALSALGIQAVVQRSHEPALRATLDTPNGRVTLLS